VGLSYLQLLLLFSSAVGLAADADYKAANAGLEEKKACTQKNPNSNLYQRHEAYVKGYNEHLNSYTFGRQLSKWGVVEPGTVEGCNPGDPELQRLQNELQKDTE